MESKSEASHPIATWSQKFTDFTIALKSGQELQVHKFVLAENSPVFETMLRQDMKETKINQVNIDQFDEETVVRFLQYLYSDSIKDETTLAKIRSADGPGKHIFKRTGFDPTKFTIDLMSMAHYYGVEDLMLDCTEYLKDHISDENVMKVWLEAERCYNNPLYSTALEHLIERPQGKTLQEIPGFQDAFEAHGRPLKDLLSTLSEKNSSLRDEIYDLKEKYKHLSKITEEGLIKITITTANKLFTEVLYLNASEKVTALLHEFQLKRGPPPEGKAYCLTKTPICPPPVEGRMKKEKTLLQNHIYGGTCTTLYLWIWTTDLAW